MLEGFDKTLLDFGHYLETVRVKSAAKIKIESKSLVEIQNYQGSMTDEQKQKLEKLMAEYKRLQELGEIPQKANTRKKVTDKNKTDYKPPVEQHRWMTIQGNWEQPDDCICTVQKTITRTQTTTSVMKFNTCNANHEGATK